jgi:hypothetical protein
LTCDTLSPLKPSGFQHCWVSLTVPSL